MRRRVGAKRGPGQAEAGEARPDRAGRGRANRVGRGGQAKRPDMAGEWGRAGRVTQAK